MIESASLAAQRRALADRVDALEPAQVVGAREAHHHGPGIVRDTVPCPACATELHALTALDFLAREVVETDDAPDRPAPQVQAPRALGRVARGTGAQAAPRGGEGSGGPDDVGVGAAGSS
jgi:hypothetical protein